MFNAPTDDHRLKCTQRQKRNKMTTLLLKICLRPTFRLPICRMTRKLLSPKFFILFTIVSILVLTGCKKVDSKPEEPQTPPCPVIDPTTFNGCCWTSVYTTNFGTNGIMTSTQDFIGRFSKTPSNDGFDNEIANNHISVNGNSLALSGSSGYLFINAQNVISKEDNWSFRGDSIPSFDYTNKNLLPEYSDLDQIPDTISRASSFSFTINVQNMSSGTISLGDSLYGKSTKNNINIPLVMGQNVISVVPSQLLSWGTSSTGFVVINMNNSSIVNACSRNYKFVKSVQVVKSLVVKP